ncbi:MAG: glycoside hydrolase family 140 protein [Blastocatellales bacterium]|nr:glycoside hydrolase family 140 protein [Blastocatellales bacterium]
MFYIKTRPVAYSILCLILAALAIEVGGAQTPALPGLRVSENRRFLVTAQGEPFFWLGDTAWELFHRLNREEAEMYLKNRAQKGFTVIQAVALAELDGLNTPNAYGHRPLINNDPLKPDVKEGGQNDYWDHVDFIINKAGELGLRVGLLPTWGDKWQTTRGGRGPVVFNAENARGFGEWMGRRYRDAPVIWILGGDRNIYSEQDRAIIEAMARGLRRGDGGAHLITFHPRGPGRSSDYFHNADWLDFNMSQSSHAARDHDNGLFTAHDYALDPVKPTLDGEPRYEHIPVGFYLQGVSRHLRFDDYDVRQAAYWSMLAGACGHTYGNNNIWQMWAPGREPVIDANVAWREALDHPGALQMGIVRRLFESRPFIRLAPYDAMIVDGPRAGGAKVRAALADDGSFAFVYSPRGESFTLRLDAVKTIERVNAWWFDPRYGNAFMIHTGDNAALQTFTPPGRGRGQDWILVLDDSAKKFPAPGIKER